MQDQAKKFEAAKMLPEKELHTCQLC